MKKLELTHLDSKVSVCENDPLLLVSLYHSFIIIKTGGNIQRMDQEPKILKIKTIRNSTKYRKDKENKKEKKT